MKAIYTATAPALADDENQAPHLFVSIDDKRWHEIDDPGEKIGAEHYDAIAELFEWEEYTDEDGRKGRRGHITLAKRYLMSLTPLKVTFAEPIVVES